jgi:RNA polymerase sigma-70 factor (ECF subfamily)
VLPNEEAHSLAESDAPQASDHSLLGQYRRGSQDAAHELYRRYSQRLRALARAQMSADLAGRVEVDDIVQSVFGSFFRGVRGDLYDVPQGEELWKLLLVIALHKIRNQGTYHQAAKRDVRRTVSTDDTLPGKEDDGAASAFMKMVVDEALSRLSPTHRRMVELRMEGFTVEEIAAQTKRARRTIERMLQQARAQLDKILADEP